MCSIIFGNLPANFNLDQAQLKFAKLKDANFTNSTLRMSDLTRADLSNAIFTDADLFCSELRSTTCINSNLERVKLDSCDLRDAKFENTNLAYAFLANSHLNDASLKGSNLSNAILINTNLSRANLANTNLSNSVLLLIEDYADLQLNEETNFKDSIIDDPGFITYLNIKKAKGIPKEIGSKQELKRRLQLRNDLEASLIEAILKLSTLPNNPKG
ncbi:MAG: hypothetical protein GEU26_13225 [Nitrososphaeraceae archaeon]|nr:hypothetical protein [Nitrososphaeraceae archaeon]